jgi:hypothetical protein
LYRNKIPCQCCYESYRRSFTDARNPKGGEIATVHAMWPFYGCVSIPLDSFLDGRCGNCCWTEKQCSWQLVHEGRERDPDPRKIAKAGWDWEGDGTGAGERVQMTTWKTGRRIEANLDAAVEEQESRYRQRRAEDKANRGK